MLGLKNLLKQIIGTFYSRQLLRYEIGRIYWIDFQRFLKYSSALEFSAAAQRRSEILRHVHALEKGLAMPSRKKTFGLEHIAAIKGLVENVKPVSDAKWICDYATEIINEVENWNRGQSVAPAFTGLRIMKRDQILRTLPGSPEAFFQSRRSVRKFSIEPVKPEILARALTLAMEAPSACNRQSSRVRYYQGADMQVILNIQMGASGFGHLAGAVAVVTGDLHCFFRNGEQHQVYVDGGIFVMSIIMALHSLGLGTCALNWSVDSSQDVALRKAIQLPANEVVVALVAIGHLPAEFEVAESRRRPVCEVLLK